MFTINSFCINRLNNAEFTGFFINLKKAISNAEAANLGIESIQSAFDTTLQKLVDQVYNTTGSPYTAAMQVADDRRVQIFRRIRLRLQTVLYAETNETLLACKDTVEYHLLGKYPAKIAQKAYHSKSAIIQGFIMDLRSKLESDAISALGIGSDIAALESTNNEFIECYNARSVERSEGDTQVTLKLRSEMYGYYQQICFTTQYLANTADTTLAEKATACQSFISVLNVILADAKKRYNQRLSGEVAEESGENGENGEESGSGSGSGESGENGSSAGESGNEGSSAESGNGASSESGSGAGSTSGASTSGSSSADTNAPSESGVDDGREISY